MEPSKKEWAKPTKDNVYIVMFINAFSLLNYWEGIFSYVDLKNMHGTLRSKFPHIHSILSVKEDYIL